METKNKALCALEKKKTNKPTRPSDSQIFSGKDFHESKFLHLLIPRETLMSGPGSPGWPRSSFPTSINLWAINL